MFKTAKKIRKILILFIVITVLIAGVYFIFFRVNDVEAAWFNEAWGYRKRVAVTNSAGSDLTNQRVKISFDTASLITAGKMQSSCNDIRVTDVSGNVLEYWVTSCNDAATKIYAKMDSLPSSGGVVYVYYGNSVAANIEEDLGSFNHPGTSCQMMKDQGSVSADGLYYIAPGGNDAEKIQVYCDMTTNDYGWSLVLNHVDSSTPGPNPSWDEVVNNVNTTGTYGNDLNNFSLFLGLKHWNYLGDYLRVEVGTEPGSVTKRYDYTSFSLDTGNNYALTMSGETQVTGSGSPGIYSYHRNRPMTTYDVDNDANGGNCANNYNYAWWYGSCWSGSFWGSTSGYQDRAFWDGSSTDYHDYGGLWMRGTDSMKNVTAGSAGSEEKGQGPVGWWSFDEGYGSVVYDGSSNGNNGLVAGADWSVGGECVSGACLEFNGTASDSITVNHGGDIDNNGGSVSVSAWVRVQDTDDWQEIVNVAVGESTTRQWALAVGADMSVQWWATLSDVWSNRLTSNTILNENQWYHLELVHDDSSTVKLYINGVLDKSVDISADLSYSPTYLYIGKRYGGEYLKGFVDDVRIYDYARSSDQVKTEYNAGMAGLSSSTGLGVAVGESDRWLSDGLVGYWKMDESSWNRTSNEVVDSSGNGNHGTAVADATTAAGKYSYGGTFDGTGDYVELGNNEITLAEDTAWSFATWVRMDSFPVGKYNGIFGNTLSSGEYERLQITSDKIYIEDKNNSGTGISYYWDYTMSAGKWYHLTLVNDGTDSANMELFVNGESQGKVTMATTAMAIRRLGSRGQTSDHLLPGDLDETRVYTRKLDPREVRGLYESAPGPVGYWRFDEKSTTSAYDSSGNDLTLVATGINETEIVPGKYGSAYYYDTWEERHTVTDSSMAVHNEATFEAWVHPLSTPSERYTVVLGDGGYYLSLDSSNAISAYWYGKSSPGYHSSGSGTVPNNEWTHIAAVWDDEGVKLYANGVLKNSVASTGAGNSAAGLTIGAESSGRQFDGYIDEVKVYNYARTPKQVVEDMNGGHPAGGSPVGSQIGYWKFDEGYGTTAFDEIGQQDGTLSYGTSGSVPTWTNSGKFGKALTFSRANKSYVDLGTNTALCPSSVTLSGWFKRTETGYEHSVMGNWWSMWGQVSVTTGNNLRWQMLESDGTSWHTLTSDTTIASDTWYHFTVTMDKVSETGRLYLNGVLEASDSDIADIERTGCSYLSIGASGEGEANNPDWFTGDIDEIKIYGYAMSADEVKLDYNQGKSVVYGAVGTESNGLPSFSSDRSYCPPGDTTSACAPVAEWKFDEMSGTSTNDTSGNGHTGTISDASWEVEGKIGSALTFDGDDDYVNFSNAEVIDPDTGTVEAWVKASNWDANRMTVFSSEVGPAWANLRCVIFSNSNNSLTFSVSDGVTSINDNVNTGAILNANEWYHVVGTYDGSEVRIYINGELKDSYSTSVTPGTFTPTKTMVGWHYNDRYWNGKIDNVKVYDYALSEAQVAWAYDRGKPYAHWKLDECEGETAYDFSGNGNNGAITIGGSGTNDATGTCSSGDSGDAWYNGVSGKRNYSLSFDGTDDYVSISGGVSDSIETSGTMSAWIYRDSNTGAVFNISDGGSWVNERLVFYLRSDTDTWGVSFANGSSYQTYSFAISTLPSGQWVHVSWTWDGSTSKIYLNGALYDSRSQTVTPDVTGITAWIGKSQGLGGAYFDGKLDDVRVYSYALTSEQVKNVMNGGAVNFGPNTGAP